MIVHNCQQGSDEWHRLRCGMPTASRFDQILTPKTLKPATAAFLYGCELFAEWDLGPLDEASAQWMQRGTNMESRARDAYSVDHGFVDVREVGFVTNDEQTVGCSPDGLVGEDGGLEIKVPSAKQHVAYLLEPQRLVDAYKLQSHGAIWVCERKWWDIYSWHPSIPAVCQRVERDEEIISKLAAAVVAFNEQLHAALREHGYMEPE